MSFGTLTMDELDLLDRGLSRLWFDGKLTGVERRRAQVLRAQLMSAYARSMHAELVTAGPDKEVAS